MTLTSILGFLAAAVVLQIIRYAVNSWQQRKNARSMRCQAPPRLPCKDPFGITSVKEGIKADKEKMVPRLVESRFKTIEKQEGKFAETFVMRSLFKDIVFTVDPQNVKALLATQFKDFELGKSRRRALHPLLGTGIFTADGQEWSHSRGLLRPQFTRDQISQLDLEETHVQKAMLALPSAANGWTAATDVQTIFFRLTMDSATEFLFGQSAESQMGALNGLKRLEDNFSYYFDKSQWVCTQRARFESLSFLANNKETRHSDKQVQDFVDGVVAAALKESQNEKKLPDEERPYIFLEALIATTRDPIELRSQLLNILLAGRDTTASLLSWTFLMLARNPDIFNKLREIIIENFGTYSNPKDLTFAALKSCQYLQYVMNESLRLFPVVPFNRRTAVKDTCLPRGGGPDGMSPVFVRKGQPVAYSTFVMHRRKDIWGPDAEEYKPERWANRKAGWEYVPFNGGPRICIGQQFALTEAGYVIVRMLQRFDQIQDINQDQDIRYTAALTMSPGDLLTLRMHQADDA